MDFKKYWSVFPTQFVETDFAKQVQYTIKGEPIGKSYIDDIAASIVENLAISPEDRVLDLCCGNGMFTIELAEKCKHIVGVDFSDSLVNVGKKHNIRDNVQYIESDAVEYIREFAASGQTYDKILVNGAFQYFNKQQGRALIEGMAQALEPGGRILLCGVPDARRKSGLYDTPSKMLRHYWRMLVGRERIGVWWTEKSIRSISEQSKLNCVFKDSRGQTSSPYRFDAILTGKALANRTSS
ncbi:Ubiquinone/menaquinone biosynthesis C-methylase UbiE [Kaistia soli DSM 19436]|uniref:Ubiquinone/menaquinone biosynthesis C-methylase UbiE n=1 Tax=Kaistia soli DSM 19436 TaxID=1122133 RepID=A0A1M4ZYZ2_9HYPH|nr:class I SAM-dependent methyltransferase [Kaistia soli]SHF23215.1 Ubiquinone/menaquinone biosynthesis C-methylase UbiE [Kaistia soli DSM 19436]